MTAVIPQAARAFGPPLDELDGLHWAAGVTVTAFGVRLGVRVDDAELLPGICRHLPPACRSLDSPAVDHLYSIRSSPPVHATGASRFFQVYSGSERRAGTPNEACALAVLEAAVRFDLAMSATRWTFVHAGAVGWNGRAIILPAECGHGKSRLVEALVRAGATYYSDEFAVIDGRGRVHPFAKPISLRDDRGGRTITAEEIGGTTGTRPLPVGLIVATRHVPGAPWHPRALSPGEALFALLPHTLRARTAPRQVLRALARTAREARGLEGERGEAGAVAPELLRMLA